MKFRDQPYRFSNDKKYRYSVLVSVTMSAIYFLVNIVNGTALNRSAAYPHGGDVVNAVAVVRQ